MTRAIIEQLVDAMNKHGSPYLGHIGGYQAALIAAREYLAQPNTQEPDTQRHNDYMAGFNEGWDRAEKQFKPAPQQPSSHDIAMQVDADYRQRQGDAIRAAMTQPAEPVSHETFDVSGDKTPLHEVESMIANALAAHGVKP